MSKQVWVLGSLCLIFLVAGFGAAAFWRAREAQSGRSLVLATGTLIQPQRELPSFRLIDHRGQSFGPANLRGAWSVLFFGYTNCPDVCPLTLSTLASVDQRLRKEGIAPPRVFFVSVDARRDTPEKLAKYVPYFDAAFIGVTAADQASIEALAHDLGVAVIIGPTLDGGYTVDHTGALFVIAPNGKLAAVLTGPHTADSLASDFRKLLASSG